MKKSKTNDYDAIVIGAGIGGLVCGCYLAKGGLKTLIVERNAKPGGYCTSFTRQGYRFDTSVHYIGGIKKGALSKILSDLEVKDELKFTQLDPTDKIVMPDNTAYIRANPYDTINEFKESFPRENENIESFFKFIMDPNIPTIFRKVANLTFKEILNSFFNDEKLKSTASALLLGNMGLSPEKISGFTSIIFFREFLLDPGYYPVGGMQQFANCLTEKFRKFGGELILSNKVVKIILKDNHAKGVKLSSERKIISNFVVSGIDATQTFKELIDNETEESRTVEKLITSGSVFVVYLGINSNSNHILKENCNIWYFSGYNLEAYHKFSKENIDVKRIPLIMFSSPSNKDPLLKNPSRGTIEIFTNATFETKEFWNANRNLIAEEMLSLVENNIVPKLRKYIDIKVTATPHTLYKYTLNRDGAAYGWASILNQTDSSLLPQITSVRNLFLVGHWATMGAGQGGISTVALSGKNTADMIIYQYKKKKQADKKEKQ